MDICQLMKTHCKTGVLNLDLSNNRITDKGFVELCKALNDTQIVRFDISDNKITDKCTVTASGSLMRNKSLKTLNMQDNLITSQISKNKFINTLKKIDISIWEIPNTIKVLNIKIYKFT